MGRGSHLGGVGLQGVQLVDQEAQLIHIHIEVQQNVRGQRRGEHFLRKDTKYHTGSDHNVCKTQPRMCVLPRKRVSCWDHYTLHKDVAELDLSANSFHCALTELRLCPIMDTRIWGLFPLSPNVASSSV